jgi:hypothetical protein
VLNKSFQPLALSAFKLVQKIMGDRASKRKQGEDIQALLEIGVNRGELRDEIFCQVCKQLQSNPHPCALFYYELTCSESVQRGWELLSVVAITFPPSKNFEAYLKSFIADQLQNADPKVAAYAQYCQRKIVRIAQKGPRGKVLTLGEIELARVY